MYYETKAFELLNRLFGGLDYESVLSTVVQMAVTDSPIRTALEICDLIDQTEPTFNGGHHD
jgi:hypothetical protein